MSDGKTEPRARRWICKQCGSVIPLSFDDNFEIIEPEMPLCPSTLCELGFAMDELRRSLYKVFSPFLLFLINILSKNKNEGR